MAAAVFALTAGVASTALALPTYGTCSGCHAANSAVTVNAIAGTANASTTQYTISVANSQGAVGWAVFNGATKVSSAVGSGTTIALTNGVTYTIFGAGLDGIGNQIGTSMQVTPVAPPAVPDVTAPTTISDVKAAYAGPAVIKLTATDNAGGSGVAHTYYILDGGTQAEGTTISTSVIGTHTIEFWSVDASSNAEAHTTAGFTVSAAPAPVLFKYTYKFNLKKKVYKKLRAVLRCNATGKKYYVTVSKKGVATWKNLPAGKYRLSTLGNLRFKFKARTVKVGV